MLLLAGVLSFVFAEKICDSLLKARGNFKACLLSVTVLCGSEILLLVCRSASTLWLYYWIALCSAAALFVLGFSVFGSARLVAPFGFLAGISYELYLVHYPFAGHLPLMTYFSLTIVSAWALSRIVKVLIK
jgi:peptidoglycan/LPS O-acetylase OafA/YrhL